MKLTDSGICQSRFERMASACFDNVFCVFLWGGARVLISSGGEKMLGKVMLWAGGYSARTHMPGDGDGRKHECKKAERRDGKENRHTP
jgi:hypothetical protein